MAFQPDRREFLTGAAGVLAGAAAALSGGLRSAEAADHAQPLNLAIVGDMYIAGHFYTALHAYPNVTLAALCNPDLRRIEPRIQAWAQQAEELAQSDHPPDRRAADLYRRLADSPPPAFSDPRDMLATLGDQLDAVVVSTFDHQHAPICAEAMRRGIHVFCERPLGLTPRESAALQQIAAETGVVTSIRNPGNASGQFRRGVELLREGAIGDVTQVRFYFDRPGAGRSDPPQGTPQVPEELDWDAWLGPAPHRPYHPEWMLYAVWRDFSNGNIGTFGPHAANLPFMGLNLHQLWRDDAGDRAVRVQATCPEANRLSFPPWERVRWLAPARGDMPPVAFTWHGGEDFGPDARQELRALLARHGGVSDPHAADELLGYAGCLIIGSEGMMVSDDHNVRVTLLPEDTFADRQPRNPRTLPSSRGHYHDWLAAIRGEGPPPLANFHYASRLSRFLMLANVATQFPEEELAYRPRENRVTNHADADAALGYEYREGWRL